MADFQHRSDFQHRPDKLTGERGSGPSRSQILALVTLLPVSATLLFLAGITFAGTLIGLAVATPVFVLFSPVLVPAALTIGLAVMGFLTSGAFGVTALSSLSWMANYVRRMRGSFGDQMEHGKRRGQDAVGYMGQKVKETGQAIEGKAQAQGQRQDVGSK